MEDGQTGAGGRENGEVANSFLDQTSTQVSVVTL